MASRSRRCVGWRHELGADMMILTRAELDQTKRCDECGEVHDTEPMYMTARCHPKAGLEVIYQPGGVLHVHCAKCSQCIALIAVAETVPEMVARH